MEAGLIPTIKVPANRAWLQFSKRWYGRFAVVFLLTIAFLILSKIVSWHQLFYMPILAMLLLSAPFFRNSGKKIEVFPDRIVVTYGQNPTFLRRTFKLSKLRALRHIPKDATFEVAEIVLLKHRGSEDTIPLPLLGHQSLEVFAWLLNKTGLPEELPYAYAGRFRLAIQDELKNRQFKDSLIQEQTSPRLS